MSEGQSRSAAISVLRGALERLLTEPGGVGIDGSGFRGPVWGFLDALCGVPGGEALLEQHGGFVWLNTAPSTPYAKARERGRRHVVESFPLALQQREGQKSTASALEAERGALENVLYQSCRPLTDEEKRKAREDQTEREKLDDIRWGRFELTDEAQRDLNAWWRIARDLASHAINHCADGCFHLLQIRRHGLDTFETVVAPAFHEYIKAAAKFLVEQVQTTIRDAEAAELEKSVAEGQPTAKACGRRSPETSPHVVAAPSDLVEPKQVVDQTLTTSPDLHQDQAESESAALDDHITLEEAAELLLVEVKTVYNRGTENRPEPAILRGKGKRAIWSYRKLRPWLLDEFPDSGDCLPEDYEEVMKLLSGPKCPPGKS